MTEPATYTASTRDRVGVKIVNLAARLFTSKAYQRRLKSLIVHGMQHAYCDEHVDAD